MFASVFLHIFLWCCWKLACPELQLLETAFNKILQRIWNLPYTATEGWHTGQHHCRAYI